VTFTYFVHFNKLSRPERVTVKSWQEFQQVLEELVYRIGEMPEWIIRS
jgi:hypothetical protein